MRLICIQFIFSILLLTSNISCSLNFLSETDNINTINFITNLFQNELSLKKGNLKIHLDPHKVKDYQKTLKGFIEGFAVFKGATENNDCITSIQFADQIIFLSKKLSDLKFDSHKLREELLKIFGEVVDKRQTYIDEHKECAKLYENMHDGLHKMWEFLGQQSYYDKFTMNLIGSLKKISQIFDEMKKMKKDKIEYGNKYAELIKLVFFWGL